MSPVKATGRRREGHGGDRSPPHTQRHAYARTVELVGKPFSGTTIEQNGSLWALAILQQGLTRLQGLPNRPKLWELAMSYRVSKARQFSWDFAPRKTAKRNKVLLTFWSEVNSLCQNVTDARWPKEWWFARVDVRFPSQLIIGIVSCGVFLYHWE
jgi:hypothetical protein